MIMAGYKGHIAGAALFYGIYVAVLFFVFSLGLLAQSAGIAQGWQPIVGMLVVAVLFGLFPDIDTNSKGQDLFFGAIFVIDIMLILNGYLEIAAYVGLVSMLPILGKHRGWTHSFWAMLLVPLPILLIPYLYNGSNLPLAGLYYGAAVVGYFSHLFFDGLVLKAVKRFGR